jgi:hypothetical protein
LLFIPPSVNQLAVITAYDIYSITDADIVVNAFYKNIISPSVPTNSKTVCTTAMGNFAAAHPQIPWHEMYGLRNRIVHDYEGVNLRLVWEIISSDLPELREQIAGIR